MADVNDRGSSSVDEAEREPAEPAETILDVSGLTKVYSDGTLAVDDIDFSVEQGGFCVIIGPSGCGKTTTLHSLIGKVEPTEGEVWLDGAEITDVPTYERDIGLVFQDFQLFPHMTVEENIRYGLERMDVAPSAADDRVTRFLELMRLTDLRDRNSNELSAGQKQRVALARSLVLKPTLLLLDEPLGDMDYKLQKRMERELLRIHRELDTTFVYVTHDQTQAMRLADQIIVMNDGKIEQSGSVEAVYNSPATAFVSTFVGDSNTFFGEVTAISDDGTRADVTTAFGTFAASTENLYSRPEETLGQEMAFSVRPQHLSMSGGEDNALECAVRDVLYESGSGTQVVLEAEGEGGRRKEIQLTSRERLRIGEDRAVVGWDAEHATMLERTSVVADVDLEKDILGE